VAGMGGGIFNILIYAFRAWKGNQNKHWTLSSGKGKMELKTGFKMSLLLVTICAIPHCRLWGYKESEKNKFF
jgi:hypothetical protein